MKKNKYKVSYTIHGRWIDGRYFPNKITNETALFSRKGKRGVMGMKSHLKAVYGKNLTKFITIPIR